jgi:hypothetical protein
MITANQVRVLSQLNPETLSRAVSNKELTFTTAQFVGITNGNEFAYSATYEQEGEIRAAKVFARVNQVTGVIEAEV